MVTIMKPLPGPAETSVVPPTRLANFRDMGGGVTRDGRRIKSGLLFRSEEPSRLRARDVAALQALPLRLICDLRAPSEVQKRPPPRALVQSIQAVNIPLHDEAMQSGMRNRFKEFLFNPNGDVRFREFNRDYYHYLAFERAAQIRQVLTLLAQDGPLPALLHCTAGKDRTGVVVALLQLLLGLPFAEVLNEYLRSNDGFRPRMNRIITAVRLLTLFRVPGQRMRYFLTTHPEFLQDTYESILDRYQTIENYLIVSCGVDSTIQRRLQDRFLTDS